MTPGFRSSMTSWCATKRLERSAKTLRKHQPKRRRMGQPAAAGARQRPRPSGIRRPRGSLQTVNAGPRQRRLCGAWRLRHRAQHDRHQRSTRTLGAVGDTSIKAFGERTSRSAATTFLNGDRGQAELEFTARSSSPRRRTLRARPSSRGKAGCSRRASAGTTCTQRCLQHPTWRGVADDKNETLKHLVKGFTDVKAKGHLQGEELTTQFAQAGLNLVLVKEELRKSSGKEYRRGGQEDQRRRGVGRCRTAGHPAAILAQLHTTKAVSLPRPARAA